MQKANSRIPAHPLPLWEIIVATVCSIALLLASAFHLLSLPLTESFGFVTGGICVWLVIREHMWNWPVGIANNLFFFVLFYRARLFADMGLQVIYLGLGAWGWIHWMFGGQSRSELPISRTRKIEWIASAVLIPAGIWLLRVLLIKVDGAAPFWDSLTTILSLAAQYLLCQKRIENWIFWMLADLIYVPLYLFKNLTFTALLYAFFLVLCIVGLKQWLGETRKQDVTSR